MANPLDGVRILELGQIIAGTYGCQVLSDLGAEVIKIESPEGDLGRIPSVAPYRGVSGLFLTYNRNKQSVVLNLKEPGTYTIYYEHQSVLDGQVHVGSGMAGLRLSMRGPGGDVQITPNSAGSTYTFGNRKGRSAYTFDAPTPDWRPRPSTFRTGRRWRPPRSSTNSAPGCG